jgi:hypothetical protein
MKGTKDSWKGRDEEDNKLETKTTKNVNHGSRDSPGLRGTQHV